MAGLGVIHKDRSSGVLLPRNLGEAGSESGVFLEETPPGSHVEVKTVNHGYRIERAGEKTAFISGHPEYCPDPVQVALHGTRWLDSEISKCYLAPGMRLQFMTQTGVSVLTSPIESVRLVRAS
ncbi:MAG: hypothetical protein KDC27_19780 [Acidobacteria bacterium]|nr:hypothetical protein [Acidobacteriota bacterium]